MNVKYSIIVPVYNSIDTVPHCAFKLLALDDDFRPRDSPTEGYEVIFVDDGSTDGSGEYLKRATKKISHFKLVQQENKGPASARNTGAEHANGEYLLFLDSDCYASVDLLINHDTTLFFNEDFPVIGGSVVPCSYMLNPVEQFEQYRKLKLYGDSCKRVNLLPSSNLLVKKSVFESVNGFDESFKKPSCEDYDLCKRIRSEGHKLLYAPSARVEHVHTSTLTGLFNEAYTHGVESIKLKKKHNEFSYENTITSLLKNTLLVVKVIRDYPIRLFIPAFVYEFGTQVGKLRGLFKYACL